MNIHFPQIKLTYPNKMDPQSFFLQKSYTLEKCSASLSKEEALQGKLAKVSHTLHAKHTALSEDQP